VLFKKSTPSNWLKDVDVNIIKATPKT